MSDKEKEEVKDESKNVAEEKTSKDSNEKTSKEDDKEVKTEEKKTKKEKKSHEQVKIEELESKVKALESKIKELTNDKLKALADAENYKKRIQEDAIKDRKYASQKVAGELLDPIAMLKQVVEMPASNPEVANYQIGFKMIANQLSSVLEAEGVKPIDVKVGYEFDPIYMEAIDKVSDESLEDNVITKVVQQGYYYKDRVLRPIKVVVNHIEKVDKVEENKDSVEEKTDTPKEETKEE